MLKKSVTAEKKINSEKLFFLICLAISIIFYMIWYWHDGVIMSVDGPTYVMRESDREPGYCSFLWILNIIFGEKLYLDIAVILQCLLAGVAAAVLTSSLKKRFHLNWFTAMVMLVIEYGITLLNRFIAARRYSYYNSICTEALAYSFFILFFVSLLGILYDQDKKSLILCCVWSIILITIRKHMLITLPLMFLAVVLFWWKKKGWKTILIALASIIVCFGCVRLIDCAYNYANRGEFAPHTGDATFIFGNEIYTANPDMVEYISDEENKMLFLEILKRADEKQYNIQYAGEGLLELQDHYSIAYDRIKFDTTMVVIREYQIAQGIEEADREADFNQRVNTMVKELLPYCMADMIKISFTSVLTGLITTVLKVRPVLNELSLVLYLGYIVLLVFLWRKSDRRETSAVPFALFTLFSIIINNMFVAAALYCQMRYMLYNTAFFYQSGLLMLMEAVKIYQTKKN